MKCILYNFLSSDFNRNSGLCFAISDISITKLNYDFKDYSYPVTGNTNMTQKELFVIGDTKMIYQVVLANIKVLERPFPPDFKVGRHIKVIKFNGLDYYFIGISTKEMNELLEGKINCIFRRSCALKWKRTNHLD